MHLALTRNRIIVLTLPLIPFIDHLLEEMSSRFSEDNGAVAEIFSLVPSAVVKHDSLRSLAEKLLFWQQDLPTPSSLLSELKKWQYFWKQYTPTLLALMHLHHYLDIDIDEICTIFATKHNRRIIPRVHPLRVESK